MSAWVFERQADPKCRTSRVPMMGSRLVPGIAIFILTCLLCL